MKSHRNPNVATSLALLCLLAVLPLASAEENTKHSAITPEPRKGGSHDRHLELNKRVQARQGAVDLIFVGDSITQGWEGAGKEVWKHYYGDRKALNLGISGDRTQHVLWRMENGNLDGIQPKVAVVMIGTNNSGDNRNSASEMVDGVRAVVKQLREKQPEMKILLLGIFPRGDQFNDQRGKILQVNQTIRKLHDNQSVFFLDIGHHFLAADGSIPKRLMPDYLHLSPRGYAIWAGRIEARLASLLGDKQRPSLNRGVAGDWTFSIRGPDDRMSESLMHLELKGKSLGGFFLMNEDRRLTIVEGSYANKTLKFKINRKRPNGGTMTYHMTGTLGAAGKTIKGKAKAEFDGQERTVDWSAKRGKP